MPTYQPGTGIDQVQRLHAMILKFAEGGPFSTEDVMAHVFNSRISSNAGDVAASLDDLSTSGQLRQLPSSGASRYELP